MPINTFDDYCKEPCTLTFEQMKALHDELIAEIGNDPEGLEFYDELVEKATRYATMRASWPQMSHEEKMDKDSSRTSNHNSIIVQLNLLSRYLRMQGKPALWRDRLGYEEDDKYNRKAIGDFACYIVFVNSLCAR